MPRANPNAGSADQVTAAERRARVVALRRQRYTFEQIGQSLGVSAQRAFQLYQAALAMIPAAHVEEHRVEELTLIDDAIRNLLQIAQDHESPRTAVEAWEAIKGWAERKAKLLGLDAPTKHEIVTMDAIESEIAKLRAEMDKADDHAGAAQA